MARLLRVRILVGLLALAPAAQALQDTAEEAAQDPALTSHAAPRELAKGAITEEVPSFMGPRRDGHSAETKLLHDFGPEGPTLLWERSRGEGYAAPSVAEGVLVFTHSSGNQLQVEALDPTTGAMRWRHTRSFDYEPRYIRNKGPRAAPLIHAGKVYVLGVDNTLCAFELRSGKLIWKLDLRKEYGATDDFFGAVGTPLLVGETLILNIGAKGGPSIVALSIKDGSMVWGTEDKWGPSCASPVLAEIRGKEQLLVMAGGDSRPPTGGLLVLDPKTGEERYRYPFRSRTFESVLGASPVVSGEHVLISAGYNTGTAALYLDDEGIWSEAWKTRDIGCEFQNPIVQGGLLHLVDGVNGRVGAIVAMDPITGEERANTTITWKEELHIAGSQPMQRSSSIGQASLLYVDGAFLVLGDFGHLLWISSNASGAKVTARTKLFFARETWTPPIVHRGLLYVCQNNPDQETGVGPRLLCYDLRGK
ncbi:MAG: outer membrane protein assembly factor BamB [Planctomycetota bacterium]|jgi:outer membrane protein assembly factor BamB